MSCKHPLTGVCFGRDPTSGKKIIKVLPIEYKEQVSMSPDVEYIPIPCGKCIDCRLQKGREWSARCMFETKYHNDNYFITLTYDDDHIPINEYNSYMQEFPHPLKYSDVQGFIKRLRSHFDEKYKDDKSIDHACRYYGCGEYGPSSMRPHYHLIMFGLPLDDLKVKKVDIENGFTYFTSKTIADKWNNGFHLISKVTYETCAYVAQYVLKKQYGKGAEIYEELHIPPEFSFMSRRPGIGRQYYEDHKGEIYKDDQVLIASGERAFHSRPPKYFDRLYDIDEHEEMEFIRSFRSSDMEMSLEQKKNNHSGSYRDILDSEERNQIARTKILKERSKVDEPFI